MRVETTIEGTDALMDTLRALPATVTKPVRDSVAWGVVKIWSQARRTIKESPRGGHTMVIYRDGMRLVHVASASGEPPAIDTGRLVNSIAFEIEPDGLTGYVGTNVIYGKHLEYGTKDMVPRPWLLPSYTKWAKRIIKKIAVSILKTFGRKFARRF